MTTVSNVLINHPLINDNDRRGSPYKTHLIPVRMLPETLIQAMAAVYLGNFNGSSNTIFRADLNDKDEAILLYCDTTLVGFTLLKIYGTIWNEHPIRVVYSGDTIVAPEHWGQQALAFAWITRAGQIRQQAPKLPLYWFLLVKGHRTYKYLSVFSKSFFPHWQEQRADLQALATQLAISKFGCYFDAATGLVRFPDSRGHLNSAIAEASPAELTKAATRFFLQKNPDYRQGDELVCLCELTESNMKPLAARIFRKAATAVLVP